MPAVPAPGRIAPWLALGAVAASLLFLRPLAEARRPPRVDVQLDVPGIPADIARPLAFGFRSLVGDLVLLEAIQLHGGIGLTDEHSCHLFLKRAMLNLQLGGDADQWREASGRQALAVFAD